MEQYNFVVNLVKDAGELLLKQSKESFEVTMKNNDPRDIVTAVDIAVNDFLVNALKKEFPTYGVYSEEGRASTDTARRDSAESESEEGEYMWVIDPIDGSSNFARHIPHFAICVGLIHKGDPILGVVYNPVTRELFSFKKGVGAYLNGERIGVSKETELKNSSVLLHAGRKPELWKWGGESYTKLLEHAKKTTNLGGSALDACFVASGRVEGNVYGRLSTMDIASAMGILYEAGGVAVGIDGEQVVFSTEPQKVFMANNQKMAKHLVAILG